MGVDHRPVDIAMPQPLLDGSNVRAVFEQLSRKGMPKRVVRGPLCEPGLRHGFSDGVLHQGFINMMATLFLRLKIHPSVFLRKDLLPAPAFPRVWQDKMRTFYFLQTSRSI